MKRIFAGAVATAVRHPTLSRQRGDHKDLGMRGLLEVRQSKVCAVHAPVIVDIDQPPKDRKIVYLLKRHAHRNASIENDHIDQATKLVSSLLYQLPAVLGLADIGQSVVNRQCSEALALVRDDLEFCLSSGA